MVILFMKIKNPFSVGGRATSWHSKSDSEISYQWICWNCKWIGCKNCGKQRLSRKRQNPQWVFLSLKWWIHQITLSSFFFSLIFLKTRRSMTSTNHLKPCRMETTSHPKTVKQKEGKRKISLKCGSDHNSECVLSTRHIKRANTTKRKWVTYAQVRGFWSVLSYFLG